jgi:hypothetical protein
LSTDNLDLVITKNDKRVAPLSPYLTDQRGYAPLKAQSAEYLDQDPKVSYEKFMEIYDKSDLGMEFIYSPLTCPSIRSKEPDLFQPDPVVACDLEGNVIDGRYMGTPALVVEILSPAPAPEAWWTT